MLPAFLLLSPPRGLIASPPLSTATPQASNPLPSPPPAASSSTAPAPPSSRVSRAAIGSSGPTPAGASPTACAGARPWRPTPCCPPPTGGPSTPPPSSPPTSSSSPAPTPPPVASRHLRCTGIGEEEPQGWEARCAAAPKVLLHADGDLRMYYHSFDKMSQGQAIGVARSRDGIRWARSVKVLEGAGTGSFDGGEARQGHVVRDRAAGRYVMVYEGLDRNGRVSIGTAVSEDGMKRWRRCSELPVLRPSEEDEGWDGTGAV